MIAITGSQTGFLSSHLLKSIPGSRSIPRIVRKDYDTLKFWLQAAQPSHLIHCAGLADVRRCIDNPKRAFEVNLWQTQTVLDALEGTGIKLLYVATDKVFGDQENCTVTTPFKPLNAYDASKIAAEMLVEEFAKLNPCIIARFPNFYGPGDPHKERLFPAALDAIKEKREHFTVRTVANTTRQYIFIKDAVLILNAFIQETYTTSKLKHHFGTPHIRSVLEVLDNLCAIFSHKVLITEENLYGEATHLSINLDTDLPVVFTGWEESLQSFL